MVYDQDPQMPEPAAAGGDRDCPTRIQFGDELDLLVNKAELSIGA